MTISIFCPKCGRQFSKIKSEFAGKKVRCTCGEFLRLPEASPSNLGLDSTRSSDRDSNDSRKPRSAREPGSSKGTADSSKAAKHARNPFELHYSDLDQILAKPQPSDSDFDPQAPLHNARTVPPLALPPESDNEPMISAVPARRPDATTLSRTANGTKNKSDLKSSRGTHRIGILFLLAIIASFTAFGFAMFLLSARWASDNFIWQGAADETVRQIYAGQFGIEAVAPRLKLGFQTLGWVIVGLASALTIVASLQMIVAGIQLYVSLRFSRWVDGLMATIAVTMLFLMIGALFLHGSHTQNLKRQIDQATVVSEGEEPPNIQRLRAQLRSNTDQFQWTIAGLCIAPATIFGCSILRLFARI